MTTHLLSSQRTLSRNTDMRVGIWLGIGLTVFPGFAFADASVAGYWAADLGDRVTIEMNLGEDGQWNSTTAKANETIAEMAGKYQQQVQSPTSGRLIFVPSQAHVTSQHGAPKIEHDVYRLSSDGRVLSLTASGDTMEFHKLTP
jgi:hypothetical protein